MDEHTSPRGSIVRNIGDPIAATDSDNDPLTYSITGEDAAFFTVVTTTGQLRNRGKLDYESRDSYTFTVSVHDGKDVHGNDDTTSDDTISVTVTVNDVDDPLRITGPAYKEYQEERTADVGTYTASDQDGPATQWVLTLTGNDSDDFTLSSDGVLTFNDVPNFEGPTDSNRDNIYRVIVNATEQGGGTAGAALHVTIEVYNADEPGVFVWPPVLRVGKQIVLELADPDYILDILEWRWERSADQSEWTVIESEYSSTYTPAPVDEDQYLRATVFYHDEEQYGKSASYVTSQIVQVGPIFDSETATASVQENAAEDTSLGQFQARHSNSGETLTYFLSGGDLSYFDIDSSTGELETSSTPLDYEGLPDHAAEVEITARDNNGRTATTTVTVTVTNECASTGEPPCAPSVSAASSTSLRVTWTAPASDSHDVQYRESGSSANWTEVPDTGANRSHTITGLTTGTTYEVRVRTVNGGVGGDWSPPGTGSPRQVTPGTPSAPRVSAASSSSLRVTWSPPSGGPTPTSYELQYREDGSGSWSSAVNAGNSLSRTITGLSPGTSYQVQVRARNSAGPGGWSSSASGGTDAAPSTRSTGGGGGGGTGGGGGGGGFVPPSPPAPPAQARAASSFQRVEEIFRPIASNGTLTRVWRLLPRSQSWLFYDPSPEFEPFNTMSTINVAADPAIVVSVVVSRSQRFRGMQLFRGINAIPITQRPLTASPGSGIRNLEQLLEPLIRNGLLERVWWLDSRTQRWLFYDPDP